MTEKKAIEIEGAILTDNLLKQIKNFQENDNNIIHETRNNLADAICHFGKNLDTSKGEELEFMKNIIVNLSYIREYINEFSKP